MCIVPYLIGFFYRGYLKKGIFIDGLDEYCSG